MADASPRMSSSAAGSCWMRSTRRRASTCRSLNARTQAAATHMRGRNSTSSAGSSSSHSLTRPNWPRMVISYRQRSMLR
ncbi:hypothetical protein FQZ97_992430 [compost metagenome]